MKILIKIFLTVVILIFGLVCLEVVRHAMHTRVATGGIGPFIIYPAMLAGIFAVWKYKPVNKNSSSDSEKLNKN